MKFLRIGFIHRSISIFLLLVFIQPLASPYYSFALTSGAHQPEFTSYEDGSSADMVNLLTGDFAFNLPILDVPGPEGNFSLPLSYHAGISPEQESSWAGMGFNINAGSIVRDINQYPDDASGEPNYVTVQDLTGVSGWNRTFNHPYKDDWNSQTGHHGNINLLDIVEVDFGSYTSVGIVGVHVGDDGLTFDPVQFIMAATTILSFGIGGAASATVSAVKNAAVGAAISTAVSFSLPVNTPGAPTAGDWKYTKKNGKTSYENNWKGGLSPVLFGGLPIPIVSKKKPYKIYLDQTRTEDMFGTLYLGNPNLIQTSGKVTINSGTPQSLMIFSGSSNDTDHKGSASDINFNFENDQDYSTQHTPTLLATDSYAVNASNVSGSITPYRLEVGSVAMPRSMTSTHKRHAPLPYLNNYKVPYIYEGTLANGYINHAGGLNSVSPLFYYGSEFYIGTCLSTPNPIPFLYPCTKNYILNDVIFSQRIPTALDAIKKIPQGNNVEWLTNNEIRSSLSLTSQACPYGFMDFLSGSGIDGGDYTTSDRHKFRSNYSTLGSNPFPSTYTTSVSNFTGQIPVYAQSVLNQLSEGSTIQVTLWNVFSSQNTEFSTTISAKTSSGFSIPTTGEPGFFINKSVNISFVYTTIPQPTNPQLQDGIGGYSITSADGVTYHFALPVYEYQRKSESILITDPNKRSIIGRNPAFATTWLLTSITGPDFVDRNANGLVDEGDWGYWVKMNYGKHADAYDWRMPYATNNDTYMTDIGGTYKSYEKGKKQLYYLNSIETRSHVALFMKSGREDGKSAAASMITPLKLDEICLLKKEHYKKLLASYGISTYTNKITNLCLSSEYDKNTAPNLRTFINKNCLKRVLFKFDYNLCKNTPNAGGPNNLQQGKLTLTRISIKGRNDVNIVPDYKFEYNNNPNYNTNYWDGWGMYSSSGTSAPSSHKTNDPTGSKGSAWSLTKITTPLGSDLLINYERDSYGSVSGEILNNTTTVSYNNSNIYYGYPSEVPVKKLWLNPGGNFSVGDKVNISGLILYKCTNTSSYVNKVYSLDNCTITAVGSNYITVAEDYMGLGICGSTTYGNIVHLQTQAGSVTKVSPITNKQGGNIRVGSIVMRDELGKENKIRYIYSNDDGSSSGVVAQEPDYIKTQDFPFYNYLKYPQTPVIYGKVSVLSGLLSTDSDFYSKQIFEFETPHKSMITLIQDHTLLTDIYNNIRNHDFFKIEDRTSKIGVIKSVKIFSKTGIVSESQLIYTDHILNNGINNNQGIFTESTLLGEEASVGIFKNNRTTVLSYPYTLKKIINSKDGFTSSTENLSWDLITGAVTETLSKSSLGVYIKTVSKPAYTVAEYGELGSKAYNINNRNMLLQNGATYVYRSDAMGSALGLISAEAQTWSKGWTNYRVYDAALSTYNDEGAQTNQVWRKGAAYTWTGNYSRLQPQYGTQNFTSADEFNFASPSWQYLGEITRFDHYGMPLESVDFNKANANAVYSSVKMGYDNRTIIASAANAKYNEIAFSSAEDKISTLPYFGGEVGLGSGTLVTTSVHTGNTALSVPLNSYGFVFKSSELSAAKTYRASVWTNSTSGRIYYKLGAGVSEVIPTQTVSSPVAIPGMGNWYRIDMTLKNPGSAIIEVGVKSTSGTIIFDDFRFQPADAVMTCYVYPPPDYEFTIAAPTYSPAYAYSLDNDNFFTKHELNEKGELVKVYAESLLYGVKLISESKSNLSRFNTNP